ncbi:MAG: FAD-dependent oxidoreductase [Saprospiraceae bacterium]|nr:FAD-dependent oxidoreductase [Saprospiraceae bacterium]
MLYIEPVSPWGLSYRSSSCCPPGCRSAAGASFFPVPSYTVPLSVLLPQKVKNFIVAEKAISVSNIVNGTTRLQPVVLQIGQAAGSLGRSCHTI